MADELIKQVEEKLTNAEKTLTEVKKGLDAKVGTEELKSLRTTIETLTDKFTAIENVKFGDKEVQIAQAIKNIQDQANNIEKDIKSRLFELGEKPKNLNDRIKGLVESDGWKNHMKQLKSFKTGQTFEIEKAANDLLTSDWTADTGAVGLPQMQLPGVTKHPWKNTPIFAAVPKRTVAMDHQVSYTEELSRSDAAALKAEGSQYAQSGATWITRVLSFFDFGHYVKVTRESLEDAEYIRQEMNDLLQNGLLRAIEKLLYSGGGTTTVEGVYTAAQTFAKPLGAKTVANPSMRDVLMAAKLYVSKGYNAIAVNDANKTGYMANLALIGKSSGYNVTTEKDDIGRPLVESLDNWRLGGLSVVESEDVTETDATKDFLVGDFNRAMLFLKRNLIIETGYDGNDFTYGMTTIRASIRGNLLIKNLDKYAFVKGNFETAPALLQA